MSDISSEHQNLRVMADGLVGALQYNEDPETIALSKTMLKRLRDAREFERLISLAECLVRLDQKDVMSQRFLAQGLIDTGNVTVAIRFLKTTLAEMERDHPEYEEVVGLIGRANKQLFIDSVDRTSEASRNAIEDAIAAYRVPYEDDPANYWHGINLCAVVSAARRVGVTTFPELDARAIAENVLREMERIPEPDRDEWFYATNAEGHLALGNLEKAERALHHFVVNKDVHAFQLGSTLRQFTEVWDLHGESAMGAGLVQILESELAKKSGALLQMSPGHVRAVRNAAPAVDQLERVLGDTSGKTLAWYKTGLERAASVAAIWVRGGERFGTGFAVRGGDLGFSDENEILVLTNFHVVNKDGVYPGRKPGTVEIAFEAGDDAGGKIGVRDIVWSSPFDGGLDAALLRLDRTPDGIEGLPLTCALPSADEGARVYVIGHPRGHGIHISLQDNKLLDHEGPDGGNPPNPDIRRVHYHAPTEPGSSGSPVFNDASRDSAPWQVIALHHMGTKLDPPKSFGLPMLNGKVGSYSANEGIWIGSIVDAIKKQLSAG